MNFTVNSLINLLYEDLNTKIGKGRLRNIVEHYGQRIRDDFN